MLVCQLLAREPGPASAQMTARLFNSSAVVSRYRMPMEPPARAPTGKLFAIQTPAGAWTLQVIIQCLLQLNKVWKGLHSPIWLTR